MALMDRVRDIFGSDKAAEALQQENRSENTAPVERLSDYNAIRTVVGIPEARRYELEESRGDINLYRQDTTGSRINVGPNGEFYDGELRRIGSSEASSFQRMTQEWRYHAYDDTSELHSHLTRFAAPEIERFVQEQKLEGMHQATPEQQAALTERLQARPGLAHDSATLAMLEEVATQKHNRGLQASPAEQELGEYHYDTLRGKDGAHSAKESREERFAREQISPALEKYAQDHGIGLEKLSDEQVRQVGLETGRWHQIPEVIAREQAMYTHNQHERDADRRSIQLESAVGEGQTERYTWKQTTANIESYQHNDTGRYLHVDREGKFYNQGGEQIGKAEAVNHAAEFPSVDQINAVTSRALTEKPLGEQARIEAGMLSVDQINAVTSRALSEDVRQIVPQQQIPVAAPAVEQMPAPVQEQSLSM